MLSGGLSLEVFKHWAPSEQNMIILPGFCMSGTVGSKLVPGKPTRIDLDKRTQIDIRCQVHHLSFSAHTDAKGIMDLVKHVAPRNVVLVHGEKPKMAVLKSRMIAELGIPCFDPANHETVKIAARNSVKISMSNRFLIEAEASVDWAMPGSVLERLPTDVSPEECKTLPVVRNKIAVEGVLVTDCKSEKRLLHQAEVPALLGVEQQKLSYSCVFPIYFSADDGTEVEDQLQGEKPMNVLELARKLRRSVASTKGNSTSTPGIDKEATVQPEKKRLRGSLQRVLSLDLERVPEAEEGDEVCLNFDLDGVYHDQQCPTGRSASQNHNAGSANPRIDLDINVVPDVSSAEGGDIPDATSVLHGVYAGLAKWLGDKVTEGRESIRGGRTLSIRVAPRLHYDPYLLAATESQKLIAFVECEWEDDDSILAHRVLGLLRNLKLNFV
eukprot:TRINITY_DN1639_c0_g1_i8.p1 TRINITY_DN1639_c0_g1~~TRINITY_DN1639_c0_g1_i8.p1  ORF type:complete len:440 (-),score=65.99 TRINITY_DN1639_c0_g1_i8:496-1815(-)